MAIIANMNRGGSKPGERRGGRKKGSLNKATIERALMAEREVANAHETRLKLAKDHLEELVGFYAQMAISEPDEVRNGRSCGWKPHHALPHTKARSWASS
jgi:hypothetical protein